MKTTIFSAILTGALLFSRPASVSGQVGNNNPTGVAGQFNGNITTGCSYDPYTGNATRTVTDLVVAGAVGKYGLSYSRTWNSRNGVWLNSFQWSIATVYKPSSQPMYWPVTFPDGRVVTFSVIQGKSGAWGPAGVRERFTPAGSLDYLILPDGGKIEFSAFYTSIPGNPNDGTPNYDQWTFQTNAIIDPYGQRTSYSYNANGTLNKVTEPAGRYIQFFYTASGQIDHIQASDGRTVNYTYTNQVFPPGTTSYSVLTGVSYYGDPTLNATYTYDKPNVGNANGWPVLKTCSDPMYAGPMKTIFYSYATQNNPDGTAAVWGQLASENSGTTGQAVSSLTVLPNSATRIETRADGKTRTIYYPGGNFSANVGTITDFKGVTESRNYDSASFLSSITDRNGHTTNFTNNSINGALTQIQYPSTPNDTPSGTPRGTVTYTYGWAQCPDPNNQDASNPYYLYSVTDEGGNATIFTRDTSKRVVKITYPDGAVEQFTYNSFGQVLTHTMKTGGVESFSYDARGLKQTYRDPYHASGNPTAWYQSDAYDRVSGVTDTLGSASGDVNHTTSFAYNLRGQVLTTTLSTDPVDGVRHTITNSYNPNGDGTLVSVSDQLSHVTSYTYDDYRRVRSVTSATNHTASFFYDASGVGDDYTHTDSNVTFAVLPSGKVGATTYDENRRKLSSTPGYGTTDASTSTWGYDAVGNVTSTTTNGRSNGLVAYDERNRVMNSTDAVGNVTSMMYDAAGRKKSVTRANGQLVSYDNYDSMNRLLQQTVKQTPNPDAVTKYTYYNTGLLHTMQDPRLVALNNGYNYSYAYDQMGRKTGVTYPPDSGGVQRTESWHYDTAGRVDTFTNRAGKIQTSYYDALNRPTSISWNDSGVTPTVTFGFDIASRITSITNANSTVSRAYFNDNTLQSETQSPTGGTASTVAYTYDVDGNRASLAFPGYSFVYGYTGRDDLQSIANSSAPSSPIAQYGYDPYGMLTSRTLDNSTSSSYGYDAMDRVTAITHNLNGTTRTFGYGYDSVSNRTWTKRDGGSGDAFGYDLNDQITAGKLNIPGPDTTGAAGAQTISYDANGNRTTFAPYGTTDTYTTNNLNQYASRNSTQATYDYSGNLTVFGANISYGYDAQNRLISATVNGNTITFKYDGLNRQASRVVNGAAPIYSVWDGWQLLEEVQNGTVTTAYLTGATGFIKELVGNRYFYQDGLGSTSHLASNTGQLLESYRYDLQGTPMFYDASGNSITASAYNVWHLFTGQQWNREIGLYDLRNRAYSPDLGRFLQADPIGFAGDPSNIYRYCGNNPMTRSDPSGLGGSYDEEPLLDAGNLVDAEPVTVSGDPIENFNANDGFQEYGSLSDISIYELPGHQVYAPPPALASHPFGNGGSTATMVAENLIIDGWYNPLEELFWAGPGGSVDPLHPLAGYGSGYLNAFASTVAPAWSPIGLAPTLAERNFFAAVTQQFAAGNFVPFANAMETGIDIYLGAWAGGAVLAELAPTYAVVSAAGNVAVSGTNVAASWAAYQTYLYPSVIVTGQGFIYSYYGIGIGASTSYEETAGEFLSYLFPPHQ